MSEYEKGYSAAIEDLEHLARTQFGLWDFAFVCGLLVRLRRLLASRPKTV